MALAEVAPLSARMLLGLLCVHTAAVLFLPSGTRPQLRPPKISVSTARVGVPCMVELPDSPKSIATDLSIAVQAALGAGKRRLEIVLPDGLCFGLFGPPPGKQQLGDPDYAVPDGQKQRADVELAFLAAEIFQNMGDDVCCVFPDAKAFELATRSWSQRGSLSTRLLQSPAELDPNRKASGGGFGAAGGAGSAAGGSVRVPRVVLMVRANKNSLSALAPVVDPLGDEVLVLLLNGARLKSGGFRKGYTPTYVLRDNPHPQWRGGLLHRQYPGKWALAVGAARGRAVVHGRSDQRPSLDEIDIAFDKVKSDTSLVSQAGGLLSAAGAAAALERRA